MVAAPDLGSGAARRGGSSPFFRTELEPLADKVNGFFNTFTGIREQVNTITATIDKSDYEIYDDFLNLQIDGEWLDEKLGNVYPKNDYKGLIPTLLFAMEIDEESEIVWGRILPLLNEISICPILMCPDDRDFSCTLIVAEIEHAANEVIWRKIGVDKTADHRAEFVGSDVLWLDRVPSFHFDRSAYEKMLAAFKHQFKVDKAAWLVKNDELKK